MIEGGTRAHKTPVTSFYRKPVLPDQNDNYLVEGDTHWEASQASQLAVTPEELKKWCDVYLFTHASINISAKWSRYRFFALPVMHILKS